MKNRKFVMVLIAEAALCVVAALVLPQQQGGAFLAIAQFPFAQAGSLLRLLSLSGAAGNVFAVILYAALCLVPLFFAVRHLKKRTFKAEDGLLIVMSGFAFYMMYMMVNPGQLARIPCYMNMDYGRAVLGGAFYSLLIGYIVLRLLRKADGSSTDALLKALRALLAAVAAVVVFSIAYTGVGEARAKITEIAAGNTDPSVLLGVTYFFVVLRYVLGQLPQLMTVAIFLKAMTLCDFLRADRYGAEAAEAAKKLASLAKKTVAVILLCCAALNLAQIVFASALVQADFLATLPVDAVVTAVTALLLARFFVASRELKQDNQMII